MKNKPLLPPDTAPVPELATQAHEGTPRYADFGYPSVAPVLVGPPDTRAAGGNVFVAHTARTMR
ncbi:MAG: hypothetical protein JWR44_3436 [Hymenobacter sp.]|jgi:hypothetical protein|nr:hypothetical protein [Hymenobacter sp.]